MSTFLLKLIALLVMIVDHTGVVFQPLFDVSTYQLIRSIGRIAFPIFLFFVAEGCRRTSNIKLYLLRLGLFALITELPFDLALASFNRTPDGIFDLGAYNLMEDQNIFWTFFLGVLCVYLYREFNTGFKRLIYLMGIPLIVSLVYLADSVYGYKIDYGAAGVLFVFILYILPYGDQEPGQPLRMSGLGKFLRIAALFCLVFYLYIISWVDLDYIGMILAESGFSMVIELLPQLLSDYAVKLMFSACIALFLLSFYNNKRGMRLRWLFYAAYPLHLLVLGVIRLMYVVPIQTR
ncbi:MAG: conjugal transfer protein TraX [Clostridiales bacterium]|jgi:hypothetical protein|nr:conjugal transfer protein TraX [Clostridiales bacterium]